MLAAGRGERMGALTEARPKPLLEVAGASLIEHQIGRLVAAGLTEVVVNLAYRGAQIRDRLVDGAHLGASVRYSEEGSRALGTGGGIRRALPLLGSEPFLVVNADVWTDYPFARLAAVRPKGLAHLVLVDNPPHVLEGDYVLSSGRVRRGDGPRLTYSGIGVFRPGLFSDLPDGVHVSLVPRLDEAAAAGLVSGERWGGTWLDIGTPERLEALRGARLGEDR